MRLSRRARSVIYQNLSVGALFIIGGLIFSGMGMLNPILAALLHNAGSLIVVFNSARLIKLGEELQTPQPAKPPAAVTRPETVSVSQR
jgi:Cd2+/Zn2+-exporting ATPase